MISLNMFGLLLLDLSLSLKGFSLILDFPKFFPGKSLINRINVVPQASRKAQGKQTMNLPDDIILQMTSSTYLQRHWHASTEWLHLLSPLFVLDMTRLPSTFEDNSACLFGPLSFQVSTETLIWRNLLSVGGMTTVLPLSIAIVLVTSTIKSEWYLSSFSSTHSKHNSLN